MIFRGFINTAWFLLKCSLLAGLIGGVLYLPHLHRRVDEEIRRRIEARFAAHYAQHHPELQVTVRSAELVQGKGILVRGLRFCERGVEGPAAELVRVEEVFLTCATDIEELLKGEPEVTQVVLRRPTLRVARREDGSWSAARLLPLPPSSQRPPEVRIEDGTIEIVDPPRTPLVLRDFTCTLAAGEATSPGETPPQVASRGETRPQAAAGPHFRKFSASFVANGLRQVEVAGVVDPHRPQWSLGGSIKGLEISPELCEVLPAEWASKVTQLGSLRGPAEADFRASYDPDAQSPYQFHLAGKLVRARLDDPRLPHSLTDIRAEFACDNQGWEIRDAFARSGQSELQLSCRRQGYADNSPLWLKVGLRGQDLDPKYVDLLPPVLQEQWHRYLPSGRIDADVELSFDGSQWHPEATIQCLSIGFSYEKFPYRLDHSQGTIELKKEVLTAHLTGYSGTQPIRVDVEVHQPFSASYGWLKARGDYIPLDAKLVAAIPEKTRAVVRSLAPQGAVSFTGEVWRDSPAEPFHRHLVVGLNNCAIRYERFSYPIGSVRGRLEMRDDEWTFTELVGTNGTGRITCDGSLGPTPQGNRLSLRLTGTSVPLDEELRDALGPAMRQAFNDFKPQGTFDLEEAIIDYLPGQEKFDVDLRVRLRSENASITPVYFPYRLEKLHGLLCYKDGELRLTEFSGEHGNARWSAAGKGSFQADGSWRFQFDGLRGERVRIDHDRDLIQALPERLKKMVGELDPQGPLYLTGGLGALVLARGGQPGAPLTAAWDVELGFDQASIDVGLRLQNMFGTLRLTGRHDGLHLSTRGELNVESLSYRDFQLKRVTGPLWIDDQQVLFGKWVDRPLPGQPPGQRAEGQRPQRPITAQFAGGTVSTDGWATLGSTPTFGLHATLAQGDLARLAQEVLPGRQNLQGEIFADVELHGTGRSLNLLGGHGTIRTQRAYVYDLPVMAALAKFVRIRPPERNAVASSDVEFRIEGNHIYLDPITLSGDAMGLVGKGEMNFQGDIRLTFRTKVGRGNLNVPLLKQVMGGASEQLLLVHVGGTLQNPEISNDPFPVLNRALQQLQGDRPEAPGQGLLTPIIQAPVDLVRQLP